MIDQIEVTSESTVTEYITYLVPCFALPADAFTGRQAAVVFTKHLSLFQLALFQLLSSLAGLP